MENKQIIKLKSITGEFSVCKVRDLKQINMNDDFFFISRTDEELSLVCSTSSVPDNVTAREDGWKALRIEGILDFSLIGILAPISMLLANERIGIFVVSTYNTDYILVKEKELEHAVSILQHNGYDVR